MEQQKQLREQLVKLLQGGQAFKSREEILQGISQEEAGKKVEKLPYTIWQLLEHLRIAQRDILDFSRNPDYEPLQWPDDYWPKEKAPASKEVLDHTLQAVSDDLQEMTHLVQDPKNDLFEPFTHGDGQNLLREAMLTAEHSAYHLGEIVVLRRLLGDWEE